MAKKKTESKGEPRPSAKAVMQERPCDECAVEGRGTTSGPCSSCSPEHDKFVAFPKDKKPVQVNLDGEPVKEDLIEDEETVVAHYRFFRHGSFYLKIKDESLEKLLTKKKKETDIDFAERILSTVQKRVKISTEHPVGKMEYDEAWKQIFIRLKTSL